MRRRFAGFRMVWEFLKPYPGYLQALLLMTVAAAAVEALHVAAFFPIFTMILDDTSVPAHGGLLGVMSSAAARLPLRDPIVAAAVVLLTVVLVRCGLIIGRESLIAHASGAIQHDLKNRLLAIYAQIPYGFFLERKPGRLHYTVVVSAQRVGLLMRRVPQVVADVLKAGLIGLFLLSVMPAAMVGFGVIAWAYHRLTQAVSRRVSYRTGRGRAAAGAEQMSIANELLGGLRQIRVFGTPAAWLDRFREQSHRQRGYFVKDSIWFVIPRNVMEMAVVVILLGFILLSRVVVPGTFREHLPLVGLFAVALFQILPALTSLGSARMEIAGMLPDAELVYQELRHPWLARRLDGTRGCPGLREAIAFDRVTFAYPGRTPVLRALSLTVPRGHVTALVGTSGSGKTTIINLLLGLYEPTEGRILIDGVDLREFRIDSWRERIGLVSQDPFILHASVRDNITFGRDGWSHEAVERAARIAYAHEFIMHLPQQYDTVVGERGMKLSGGQQQRLAIARAVLSDPEMLIFDEATSLLDTESERIVQEAVERVSRQRTVLIVAHRLSTVRHADMIVVLEQGRIVEQGAHEQLLHSQGRYAQLVAAGR